MSALIGIIQEFLFYRKPLDCCFWNANITIKFPVNKDIKQLVEVTY